MKWTSPAWISSVFVLALMPAAAVNGQSTSSNVDQLAPGPVAELLPEYEPRSSFGPGNINPDTVIQPPADNPLPGEDAADVNPLPEPSTSDDAASRSTRSSLIQEPVPYNQVPQIQQDIFSLEDTFTLPRTPSVSHEYLQQQPAKLSQPAVDCYSTQLRLPAVAHPAPSARATSADAGGVCATGSNGLAPEHCQSHADQSPHAATNIIGGNSPCDAVGAESCDSCEEIVEDCGCDTCGETGCDDCEVIGGPDSYFETEEFGYADADDVSHRTIKHGPIFRHFKKHHRKKQQRRRDDGFDQSNGFDQGYFDCDTSSCEAAAYDDRFCDADVYDGDNCNVDDCDVDDRDVNFDVYQPAIIDTRDLNDTCTNTMFNVSGVYFSRNMPDLSLSSERVPAGAVPTRFLTSGDADHDNFGGIDASITRRRATGKGYELRYLNLSPSEATSTLAGGPVTLFGQFGQIGQIGGITHQQAFNLADVHEVSRDMLVQNAEFNLLRMGRQAHTRRGQEASFEYLLGFRYFKFDETLSYSAFGIRPNTFTGGDITRADYTSEVENELYGAQFGGRSEISLFSRMSLLIGLKAGIFQNNLSSRQRATTRGVGGDERIAQVLNGPNQGSPYNLSGEDTDYTMLGELDLGLTYRVTNSIRMRGGYKAIFVDDIAFADNQLGSDFRDINFNSIPQANDDLVLHGGYFGLDFAF